MASWGDVRRIARALPEAVESPSRGLAQWRVKDKLFAWERPLRRADVEALGDRVPKGPILASAPEIYFTTPHFDGYPAVLVRLKRISASELEELLVEAWLARAPKRVAKEYLDRRPR